MKHKTWMLTNFVVLFSMILFSILGSRVVSVIAEKPIKQAQRCVIIDAGHGGVDGGATSYSGVLESKLNLDIARRLDDLLHLLGIHTKMIRTEDVSVYTEGGSIASKKVSDLKNRVKIINETNNAVLISLHQNFFPIERYSGAQVFFANTAGSEELARATQTLFVKTLNPNSNRRIKKAAGIYLMKNIKCTGILIECGFISNPTEESKLLTDQYQKEICCVIASSISSYFRTSAVS